MWNFVSEIVEAVEKIDNVTEAVAALVAKIRKAISDHKDSPSTLQTMADDLEQHGPTIVKAVTDNTICATSGNAQDP